MSNIKIIFDAFESVIINIEVFCSVVSMGSSIMALGFRVTCVVANLLIDSVIILNENGMLVRSRFPYLKYNDKANREQQMLFCRFLFSFLLIFMFLG